MEAISERQTEIKRQIAAAKRKKLEDRLLLHIHAYKLPEPEREYEFHKTRKYKFDFCWRSLNLAVEVDGGTFSGGRHVRGKGYEQDCHKLNDAQLAGWRVLRFTAHMITSGEAVRVIRQAIETEKYYSIERTPK